MDPTPNPTLNLQAAQDAGMDTVGTIMQWYGRANPNPTPTPTPTPTPNLKKRYPGLARGTAGTTDTPSLGA